MLKDINNYHKSLTLYIAELWKNKSIIYSFFRDRSFYIHKTKFLGWIWYILDPLFQLMIWVFIFQFVFRVARENYAVFLFTGITAWGFINSAWMQSMGALRTKRGFFLENRVPKMTAIISSVMSSFYFFFIQTIVLFVMILFFQIPLTTNLFYYPLMLLVLILFAFGGGLTFSIMELYLPDVRSFVSHITRLLFYASPIIYGIDRIPEQYRHIYSLNPLCGIFVSYKNVLLEGKPPEWIMLVPSFFFIIVFLLGGFWFFYKIEPHITKRL